MNDLCLSVKVQLSHGKGPSSVVSDHGHSSLTCHDIKRYHSQSENHFVQGQQCFHLSIPAGGVLWQTWLGGKHFAGS